MRARGAAAEPIVYDRRVRTTLRGALGLALILLGCAGPTVVATVPTPALVPLRTFPFLVVVSGPDAVEQAIADALAAHLQGDGRVVRRADRADVEAMRLRGELPAASVVVWLEVEERRDSRTRLGSRPETVCGPAGCYTRNRPDSYEIPTLRMGARVTVLEGPSARILQRLGVEIQEEGRGYARMRERASRRLLERLLAMVDPHPETVAVRLLRVALPGVEEALDLMGRGRWHEARTRLEAVARSAAFRRLTAKQRARVLYDLAIARRFDPVTFERDPERHFDAAEAALRRAVRLDPEPLYDRALRDLRAHRDRARLLREQREAAEHNYRLGRPGSAPSIPPPPPGYGSGP